MVGLQDQICSSDGFVDMPKSKWEGYQRFCPLARGLDVVGEKWTLVIIHNLLGGPARYGALKAGLPGIGSNVLSDRLHKLEAAGVVRRAVGGVGEGVAYELTERGRALAPVMAEIRRWGADELLAEADGPRNYDLSYEIPPELGLDETYEWRVDGRSIRFSIDGQELTQYPPDDREPSLVVDTSVEFMRRWAAGETNWSQGRTSGEVSTTGSEEAWDRMLVATNYPGRPPGLAERLMANRADGARQSG